jgi:thiamine-monophosphate kinase
MDVSDGLLIDAQRLAGASAVSLHIALDTLPLSPQARAHGLSPLIAATSGDDYELLFTAPPGLHFEATAIGTVKVGRGLRVTDAGQKVALPARLGWEHDV